MKISDQALLALVRMNRSKDQKYYFNQKIFCDLKHGTIDLKEGEICPEKCVRFEKLMVFLKKYEMIK